MKDRDRHREKGGREERKGKERKKEDLYNKLTNAREGGSYPGRYLLFLVIFRMSLYDHQLKGLYHISSFTIGSATLKCQLVFYPFPVSLTITCVVQG